MKIALARLVLLLLCSAFHPALFSQDRVLRVYGSSGPLAPLTECGDMFSRYHGVEVKVTGGSLVDLIPQAEKDGDIIFCGAEYLLDQIMAAHPHLIDKSTRHTLYARGVGILVRKGNPKKITALADLARGDMRLMVVNGASQHGLWEDLASIKDMVREIRRNIVVSLATSEEATEKWKSWPGIDAWITYESWYYRMKDVSDLVRLPSGDRMYRGTPIAITSNSRNKDLAKQFLDFLKTDPAHAVFQQWGWK